MAKARWSLVLVLILPLRVDAIDIPTNTLALLSGTRVTDPRKVLQATEERLRKQFNKWLEEPNAYAKRAAAECSVFPEGENYPYALPAMAYCNLARGGSEAKTRAITNVPRLLDLLITATAKRVRPPGGDLMRLAGYEKQGTFLGTLNIALGSYRRIAPDTKYEALHSHVSRLLYEALENLDGKPIESYPEYTWYFDSIMAIVSLRLFEEVNHLPLRSEGLLQKHLSWRERHASDKPSGLPIAYHSGLPRGCDLSMQVCLLAQINREAAQKLYKAYTDHHWADYGIVAGFTEWPKGKNLLMTGDIDSGPLFLGIGMTATGVGLGAALAMDDSEKIARLTNQLNNLPKFLESLVPTNGPAITLFDDMVSIRPEYLTGFLYGDAVLFYAVTCKAPLR